MNKDKHAPFLQFDFKVNNENNNPIVFKNPEQVIIAHYPEEIEKCLQAIETAVASGRYAAGYMSYEATEAFHPTVKRKTKSKMPLLWFGIFKNKSSVRQEQMNDLNNYATSEWKMNITRDTYERVFNQIMDQITNRTIEQINYTVKFKATFQGDSYAYYKALRRTQQANFNAYVNIGRFQMLCATPELFFQMQHNVLKMKPMKGTIHRGKTVEEDIRNKEWLATSQKNRDENKMTMHLMKDELKNIVQPNSIQTKDEYLVETYPTVYQMTSTITGRRANHIKVTDIIRHLFPASSIAGVPKKEALELIAELETENREIYCGTIGYITPHEDAFFNVPIRTVVIDDILKTAEYGVGGAITNQSNVTEEYEEMITKAKILQLNKQPFELLETFGLYDGTYIVYDNHLVRLQQTAKHFHYPLNIEEIEAKLIEYANKHPKGKWIVRLTVSASGTWTTEVKQMDTYQTNKVKLAKKPIRANNPLLYYKTTNRTLYEKHRIMDNELFDTLLWNETGEITEFTIGNVVVELNDKLYTPPISAGLLPGTFRAKLLKENKMEERSIYKDDLYDATNIWLINSVRKWVKVDLIY